MNPRDPHKPGPGHGPYASKGNPHLAPNANPGYGVPGSVNQLNHSHNNPGHGARSALSSYPGSKPNDHYGAHGHHPHPHGHGLHPHISHHTGSSRPNAYPTPTHRTPSGSGYNHSSGRASQPGNGTRPSAASGGGGSGSGTSGADPLLRRYALHPPDDVPQLNAAAPNEGYPDFFPPSPSQPEDQLTEAYVRAGLTDAAIISAENSSLHDLMIDRLQDTTVAHNLSKFALEILDLQQREGYADTRPAGNDVGPAEADSAGMADPSRTAAAGPRWHLATPFPTKSSFQIPPLRLNNDPAERHRWWAHLADPTLPLTALCRSVPRGYRMERLVESVVSRDLPLNRALWVIQVTGCDEIAAAAQTKGNLTTAQATDAYTRDWSNACLKVLKNHLMEVPCHDPKVTIGHPPDGGAGTGPTSLRPFPDPAAERAWTDRWAYLWRLTRAQTDQELVDVRRLLRWLLDEVTSCPLEHFVVLLPYLRAYVPEIQRARFLLRLLVSAVTDRAQVFAAQYRLPTPLRVAFVDLLRSLFIACPDAFVDPGAWFKCHQAWYTMVFQRTIPKSVGLKSGSGTEAVADLCSLGDVTDRGRLAYLWRQVERRNLGFYNPWAVPRAYVPTSPARLSTTATPPSVPWEEGPVHVQPTLRYLADTPGSPTAELCDLASRIVDGREAPILLALRWICTAVDAFVAHRAYDRPHVIQALSHGSRSEGPWRTEQFLRFCIVSWVQWATDTTAPTAVTDPQIQVLITVLTLVKLLGFDLLLRDAAGPTTADTRRGSLSSVAAGPPEPADATEFPRNALRCSTLYQVGERARAAAEADSRQLDAIERRQTLIQHALVALLTDTWPLRLAPLIARLFTELTRANLFAYAPYAQHLIARGDPTNPEHPGTVSAPADTAVHAPDALAQLGTLSESELQTRQIALYKSNYLKFDHAETILHHPQPTSPEYREFLAILAWQHRLAGYLPWLVTSDAQLRAHRPLSSAILYRLLLLAAPAPESGVGAPGSGGSGGSSVSATTAASIAGAPADYVDRLQPDTWSPFLLFPGSLDPTTVAVDRLRQTRGSATLTDQIATLAETAGQAWCAARMYHRPPSRLATTPGWRALDLPSLDRRTPSATAPADVTTPYVVSRVLDTWLLPMVRQYIVKATEVGADNWKIITRPGSSLLNPRQLATVYYCLAWVASSSAADFPDLRNARLADRWAVAQWLLIRGVDPGSLTPLIHDLMTYHPALHLVADRDHAWRLLRDQHSALGEAGTLNVPLVRYLVTHANPNDQAPLQALRQQWRRWRQHFLARASATDGSAPVAHLPCTYDTLWSHQCEYLPHHGTLTASALPSAPAFADGPANVYSSLPPGSLSSSTTGDAIAVLTGRQVALAVGQLYISWQAAHPDRAPVHFLTLAFEQCLTGLLQWAAAAVVALPPASATTASPPPSTPTAFTYRLRQTVVLYGEFLLAAVVCMSAEPPAFPEPTSPIASAHPFARGPNQIDHHLTGLLRTHWARLLSGTETQARQAGGDTQFELRRYALSGVVLAAWTLQLTIHHLITPRNVLARTVVPLLDDLAVAFEQQPARDLPTIAPLHAATVAVLSDLVGDLLGLRLPLPDSGTRGVSAVPTDLPRLTRLLTLPDYCAIQAVLALDEAHGTTVKPPANPIVAAPPPGDDTSLESGLVRWARASCTVRGAAVQRFTNSTGVDLTAARSLVTDASRQLAALTNAVTDHPLLRARLVRHALPLYQAHLRPWVAAGQGLSTEDGAAEEGALPISVETGGDELNVPSHPEPETILLWLDWFGRLLFPLDLTAALAPGGLDHEFADRSRPDRAVDLDAYLNRLAGLPVPLTGNVPYCVFQGLGLRVLRDLGRLPSQATTARFGGVPASAIDIATVRLAWLIDAMAVQATPEVQSWLERFGTTYRNWVASPVIPAYPYDAMWLSPDPVTLAGPSEQGELDEPPAGTLTYSRWLLRALLGCLLRDTRTFRRPPGQSSLTDEPHASSGGDNRYGLDRPDPLADAYTRLLPVFTTGALVDAAAQLQRLVDLPSSADHPDPNTISPTSAGSAPMPDAFLVCRLHRIPAVTFPNMEAHLLSPAGSRPPPPVPTTWPAAEFAIRIDRLALVTALINQRLVDALGYSILTPTALRTTHPAAAALALRTPTGADMASAPLGPLPDGQVTAVQQILTTGLRATLDQLEWFRKAGRTVHAMRTLVIDYHRATAALSGATPPSAVHNTTGPPTREPHLSLDHLLLSLWARMRAAVPLIPHLVRKGGDQSLFMKWVTTLIHLLNSVLTPPDRTPGSLGAVLFDLTLDVASVCADEQPGEVRNPLLAELRQLSAGLDLDPAVAGRLRRILPYELENICTADWKPNPRVTLNPWRWLEATLPSTIATVIQGTPTGVTHSSPSLTSMSAGSTTTSSLSGANQPGSESGGSYKYRLANATPLSLTLFNAKRYRSLDENTYTKYARERAQTLAVFYGLEPEPDHSTTAAQGGSSADGMGAPSLAVSAGTPGSSNHDDYSVHRSHTLGRGNSSSGGGSLRNTMVGGTQSTPVMPSGGGGGYRAPSSYTSRPQTGSSGITSVDTAEEGEIPLKRKRSP
ncbi:hypothetical protein IWQ60_009888 [Tieghemiomyces parasiticus]|uniref:Mediator of RNA polymerase II transcription subunit 12 n=1 Tax=Tieghemiomyces parasiticus TaxID=78921 RepID=A0A9W8DKF6_9FUNG|nr:hypothetical protein IWQ60_009888 [Tieghemiomyces parasiticus]